MTNREGLQGKQDKGRTESDLHKENPQMTYYFPVHEKTKENKLRKSLELEKKCELFNFHFCGMHETQPNQEFRVIIFSYDTCHSRQLIFAIFFFNQAKFAKLINV